MSLSSQNSTGVRPRVALLGRFTESASALRFRGVVSARMLLEGLWAAGLDPVTLLPNQNSSDWHARLKGFDGVLFAGGGDINPAAYGELPDSEHLYDIDDVQDANDLALMKHVLAEGIPFLALCRGMHLLNVALGGTLNQHIEPPHRHLTHDVVFEKAWDEFGLELPVVTSSCYHHQSVAKLGSGVRAVAYSTDGCIEALTVDGANGVAVQWHPEDRWEIDSDQLAIFKKFRVRIG